MPIFQLYYNIIYHHYSEYNIQHNSKEKKKRREKEKEIDF